MSGKRINSVATRPQSYADTDCSLLKQTTDDQQAGNGEEIPLAKLDAHVVLLNNYVRPHHVAAYTELAKRVRALTVLLSVPMEPDRNWQPQWEGLDVRVQKN